MITKEFFSHVFLFLIFFFLTHTFKTSFALNYKDFLLPELQYNLSRSIKLAEWNETNDYCQWSGIICDPTGHVTGLNLSYKSIPNNFINSSPLTKLESLEIIHLDGNLLSSSFPRWFADFPKLRVLTMSSCNLSGVVPRKLFQISSLETVDLSRNPMLEGSLPDFPLNSSLQVLVLSSTNFSGNLPDSIRNLRLLSQFSIGICNFSGLIPNSFLNLSELVNLQLHMNHFTGPVPSFNSLRNVTNIDLSYNNLSGQMNDHYWEGLEQLSQLSLNDNLLEGEIPGSLFVLPSLAYLFLSHNRFNGSIRDLRGSSTNSSASPLRLLHLNSNNLEGAIPRFIFNLTSLSVLLLHWNKLDGSVDLTEFRRLTSLTALDLSHNNFSVHITSEDVPFPTLGLLGLASCKLTKIPNLWNYSSSLGVLDFSDNQIDGEIPNWIWEADGFLNYANLSHNRFTSLQEPYDFGGFVDIDLHSNMLSGQVPLLPHTGYVHFVDFSSNNFTSTLQTDIAYSLTGATFFSVANNKISGTIPSSFCFVSNILQVLDLSNNRFEGMISTCLLTRNITVLNLRRNNFSGNIPDMFPPTCLLETLDLSSNHLQGQVPSSMMSCGEMQVLNLGNNNLRDAFPRFSYMPRMRVLVLRSNTFYGNINFLAHINDTMPNLQILDLATNNFSGELPANLFRNLKVMMIEDNGSQSSLRISPYRDSMVSYQDSLTDVFVKGGDLELVKIPTMYTWIDFSNNHFQGVIPETIGEMRSLFALNMSHNALSGRIPATIGNMRKLESLDLSWNNLDSEIPHELASLPFLSVLNLSYNHLTGRIPQSNQMQTLPESSYIQNQALCGFPLNKSCDPDSRAPSIPQLESQGKHNDDFGHEIIISVALGFLVGVCFVFVPPLISTRWKKWYNKRMDNFIRG